MSYTEEEMEKFRRLVQMGESGNQMDRIESRLEMPRFIEDVGRQKCDAMFEVLKTEI